MQIIAERYHDLSCGHRVHGHESKCALLHGHNYRITFTCEGPLDDVGRVIDFSIIKTMLCEWLEDHWDHRFLAWESDEFMKAISHRQTANDPAFEMFTSSVVWVPFNPTAENMAQHLLEIIGPQQLAGTGVTLIRVVVEETRKCSAEASL